MLRITLVLIITNLITEAKTNNEEKNSTSQFFKILNILKEYQKKGPKDVAEENIFFQREQNRRKTKKDDLKEKVKNMFRNQKYDSKPLVTTNIDGIIKVTISRKVEDKKQEIRKNVKRHLIELEEMYKNIISMQKEMKRVWPVYSIGLGR